MASVTQRIKTIKQPRGGYINPSKFQTIQLASKEELNDYENIHGSVIGLVVDYMTRGLIDNDWVKAFDISFKGAFNANELSNAEKLLLEITGLNDKSIIAASQLVRYDVCYRAGMEFFKPVNLNLPDESTIQNIKIMLQRSLDFFEEYGPITKDGFTFEGGYTNIVDTGDGDFMTKDTLWDFKVTKGKITSAHTLQVMMYLLMGQKSKHEYFNDISRLGFFNPRKNQVHLLNIDDIDENIIDEISKEVIGY